VKVRTHAAAFLQLPAEPTCDDISGMGRVAHRLARTECPWLSGRLAQPAGTMPWCQAFFKVPCRQERRHRRMEAPGLFVWNSVARETV
jgi:hypothetical protein